MRTWFALVGGLAALAALAACGGDGGVGAPDGGGLDAGVDGAVAADPLDPAVLHAVAIDIAAADLAQFDGDQTTRVPCDVRWDGALLARSACRKKGSGGSVDAVVGKPAFSIKFDELIAGQKLGPFDKMALDNALQDPSLLHEHVAYEVFRRAGVPAHRTAMARLIFNGEPRGLYVAAEPVDKEFLRARYGAANDGGNLYESPSVDFAVDPDGMDLKDPAGRSRADLEAAAAAVVGASDAEFATSVGALIDLDQATRFIAAELALAAEDGFMLGRNNYYLYHRPDTDRFVLLPHGQDVILGNPALPPDYPPAARLAARIRAIPALSAALDQQLAAAAAPGGALDDAALAAHVDGVVALVRALAVDDDFTVGDVATLTREAPVVKAQLAWRAALLRGAAAAPRCGDGVVHATEQCDDGGTADGDGCDASCRPECRTITATAADGGATWRLCPAAIDQVSAAAACAAGGGALIVPASAAEAAVLARVVRRELGSADVWLGLTDAAVEDTWVDASGAPAPYLGFVGREPTGGTSENCAVLDTGTAGGWRDTSCDAGYPALCRLP